MGSFHESVTYVVSAHNWRSTGNAGYRCGAEIYAYSYNLKWKYLLVARQKLIILFLEFGFIFAVVFTIWKSASVDVEKVVNNQYGSVNAEYGCPTKL